MHARTHSTQFSRRIAIATAGLASMFGALGAVPRAARADWRVGVEATVAVGSEPGPPIPPHVEGQATVAAGGYCYDGPHPVDTRVVPGAAWDPTPGRHLRPYAPVDLRLFSFRDGCYQFIGDPSDFGYDGPTYRYYGAHPVDHVHGGGWCFMIGGHAHWWRPWSHHFVVVGPWFHWQGPYDAFFWSYWPYYSFYYTHHYPRYYGGGRFHRHGHGRGHVAPPIRSVPRPPRGETWLASPAGMAGAGAGTMPGAGGWRGVPAGAGATNPPGTTTAPGAAAASPGWRGRPGDGEATAGPEGWRGGAAPGSPAAEGWRGGAPGDRGAAAPTPAPRGRPVDGWRGSAGGWGEGMPRGGSDPGAGASPWRAASPRAHGQPAPRRAPASAAPSPSSRRAPPSVPQGRPTFRR